MPRWTETISDQKHLTRMIHEMPIRMIVNITLKDGRILEGVLRRINVGNNAGEGGWQYYGECEIETLDQKRWIIDYLDIKFVKDAWTDDKAAEYEKAGLITILK